MNPELTWTVAIFWIARKPEWEIWMTAIGTEPTWRNVCYLVYLVAIGGTTDITQTSHFGRD